MEMMGTLVSDKPLHWELTRHTDGEMVSLVSMSYVEVSIEIPAIKLN